MTFLDTGRDAHSGVFSFDPGSTARSAGPWTRLRRSLALPRAATVSAYQFDPSLSVQLAGPWTRMRRSGSEFVVDLPPAVRSAPVTATLLGAAVASSLLAKPRVLADASQALPVASAPAPAVIEAPPRPALPIEKIEATIVDGEAILPEGAPAVLRRMVAAGNAIAGRPYAWGGGHGSFNSSGYDCSGAVSYVLHGAGLLDSPLASGALAGWGEPGAGKAVTVYAHGGHTFAVIAGLRWDTSGTGGSGPNWHSDLRSTAGYVARHPSGY